MLYEVVNSETYNSVFPSTTKALRFTTILELSDASGKKDRSRLPVSFAFAVIKFQIKLENILGINVPAHHTNSN